MKLFQYKGLSVVILLRDEHCPPHVHVNAGAWSARFRFRFWHNDVERWDVVPHSKHPPLAVLEGLRDGLEQPFNRRRARRIWWDKLRTVCLDHQIWNGQTHEVVAIKRVASITHMIYSARYDPAANKTLLSLIGDSQGVEIRL